MNEPLPSEHIASFRIKTPHGEIEATGPEAFVERRAAWVEQNFNRLSDGMSEGGTAMLLEAKGEEAATTEPRKPSRGVGRKRNGPSCASRIIEIKKGAFFSSARKTAEVMEKLKELATPYEAKHVAASLIDLVKRGELRRVKGESGEWTYVNP